MPDPKTIKLLVVIPDPGEWCNSTEGSTRSGACKMWSMRFDECLIGHEPCESIKGKFGGHVYLRPPSCKYSEVKP